MINIFKILLFTTLVQTSYGQFIKAGNDTTNTIIQDGNISNSTNTIIQEDNIETISDIDLENLTNRVLDNRREYLSDNVIDQFIEFKKEDLPSLENSDLELKLKAIETTLNIRFTEEIGDKIRYYILRNRKFIVKMLTESEYYFPMFEQEFDRINIPLELKYVSIIESHLKPKIKSPMGATGLWQFMYATAKYKGMKITTLEDQRRDPVVSTQYAADYFRQLHSIYDDWLLAMSAYNAGPGNINKAIRAAGGVKNYWIAREFMPKETQKYVPKIIALMYVMYYADEYLLYPRDPALTYYDVTQVQIPERLTIKYVSELIGVDSAELSNLNPMLIKDLIPSREDSYKLYIPSYAHSNFLDQLNYLNNDPYLTSENIALEEKSVSSYKYSSSGSGKYKWYTISSGDNLGYIAQKFKCKVSDLKRWNGLKSNLLQIGKKLKIY